MLGQSSLLLGDQAWRHDPLMAFEALLRSESYRESNASSAPPPAAHRVVSSSFHVYRVMFRKYLAWLARRGWSFLEITPQEVTQFFVDATDPTSIATSSVDYRIRFARLLERTYAAAGVEPNPLEQVLQGLRKERARRRSAGSPSYDAPSVLPGLLVLADLQSKDALGDGEERTVRDWAIVAAAAGAGLCAAEITRLETDRLGFTSRGLDSYEGSFRVDERMTKRLIARHEAPVDTQAVPTLRRWLHVRTRANSPWRGALLFPAQHSGTAFSSTAVDAALERLAKEVAHVPRSDEYAALIKAGVRALRSQFAREFLLAGGSDFELKQRMGLLELSSARRYRSSRRRLEEVT